MTSSLTTLSSTLQHVSILECGPCALRCRMRQCGQQRWTPQLADLAVDLVAGALTLTNATEVLVPASLIHFIETQRVQTGGHSAGMAPSREDKEWPWPTWDVAVRERRLVTWATAADATWLLNSSYGSLYANFCVPVPAGPLVAQLDFGQPVDAFYGDTLPKLLQVMSEHRGARWRAWMRAALTCAYEGTHVPPIRVAEYASHLLQQSGGCEAVLWEAAAKGLTPRWLETAAKTALAVGVFPTSLGLVLPEESSSTARLLHKSIEAGITWWATCAVSRTSLYPHASAVVSPQSVMLFTTGWNEVAEVALPPASGSSSEEQSSEFTRVEDDLASCMNFTEAVNESVSEMFPSLPPEIHVAHQEGAIADHASR